MPNGTDTSAFSLLPSAGTGPLSSSIAPPPVDGIPFANVPRVDNMTDAEANFLGLARYYESQGRNIPNYRYDPTHTAGGLYQITDTNWRWLTPGLGIDTPKTPGTPDAMAGDDVQQTRVALALLRATGPGNWTRYNPRLATAVGAGVRPMASIGASALGDYSGGSAMGGGLPTGATTDPDYNKLLASLIGPAASGSSTGVNGTVVPASASGGLTASPFPGAAPAAGTTPPPTGPPSWLSSAVGPTAANAIGSAPRGPVGQGGSGFLGGLTSLLTNPLTQAAAKGYFTAIAAPRGTSPFGRVGLGGLAAMGTLADQERQAQIIDPALQQQMSIQSMDAANRAAILRRAAMSAPQSVVGRMQTMAKIEAELGAKAQTDQERAHYAWQAGLLQNLADLGSSNQISGEELQTALDKFNDAKAQADVARSALLSYQGANVRRMGPLMESMMGGGGGTTAPGTATGGPGTPPPGATEAGAPTLDPGGSGISAIGLPAGTSIPPTMAAEIAKLGGPFVPDFTSTGTPGEGKNIRPKPGAAGHWQYKIGNYWWEIGADGNAQPVG